MIFIHVCYKFMLELLHYVVVIRLALEATYGYIVTQHEPLGRSETRATHRSCKVYSSNLRTMTVDLEPSSRGAPE